jgi:hypothetical protein
MVAALRRAGFLSLLTIASLARAAQPVAPVPTAISPLRALGIAPEAASALEATLRNEVSAMPEVRLISPQVIAASLAQEHDADCLARLACAASVASRAGARQLVSGTVSGLGDATLVDLKLVDARSGEELRRITHPITGREELLIETLHAAAVELLAPARFTGRLDVSLVHDVVPVPANEAKGALLYVDGKLAGSLPLSTPIEGLLPGRRAVRVSLEGFRDASLFVEIRFERTTHAYVDLPRGEVTSVAFLRANEPSAGSPGPALKLNVPAAAVVAAAPPPAQPRGPWMKIAGWSALGLGVVSGVVGGALHFKAYQTASALNSREATNTLKDSDAPLYAEVDTEVSAARGLYVLAGVLGAGGGALLLYDHHLDAQRMTIGATPIVGPNTGGVGVTGQF